MSLAMRNPVLSLCELHVQRQGQAYTTALYIGIFVVCNNFNSNALVNNATSDWTYKIWDCKFCDIPSET